MRLGDQNRPVSCGPVESICPGVSADRDGGSGPRRAGRSPEVDGSEQQRSAGAMIAVQQSRTRVEPLGSHRDRD
jgi:hypothetical protein